MLSEDFHNDVDFHNEHVQFTKLHETHQDKQTTDLNSSQNKLYWAEKWKQQFKENISWDHL